MLHTVTSDRREGILCFVAARRLARQVGMTTPVLIDSEVAVSRVTPGVGRIGRVLDVVAVGLLIGGLGLFALGRWSLGAIADGSYVMPAGISHVAQTEQHDAQTRQGLWIVGAGLGMAVVSAAQHAARRRREAWKNRRDSAPRLRVPLN